MIENDGEEVLSNNWEYDEDIVSLINETVENAKEMVGDSIYQQLLDKIK